VRQRFQISDDSGFLALVDPNLYQGFVDRDWTYESLFTHFRQEMGRRSLLLWGTGREDFWTVEVVTDDCDEYERPTGYRRVSGPIRVSAGQLHLTNYESLTMAAQFPDVRLPEPHLRDLVFEVPDGEYVCEIIQLADPGSDQDADEDDERRYELVYGGGEGEDEAGEGLGKEPDFVLVLSAGPRAETWREPPWHDE
jgi:hypothetical protein